VSVEEVDNLILLHMEKKHAVLALAYLIKMLHTTPTLNSFIKLLRLSRTLHI
jgi:hypothetical protein